MRAMTLTQPWAGLVASGIKLVENRSRAMVKHEDFGRPFAIHASREIDESVYARIGEIDPRLGDDPDWPILLDKISRVTSAIIGVATIAEAVRWWTMPDGSEVLRADRDRREVTLGDQSRWLFGPIGYVLCDTRWLETPIPCRGWQGFWTLPGPIERALLAQLEEKP